jgi:NADPH:quinone reductase-like Zn-dependent oxidoreductase
MSDIHSKSIYLTSDGNLVVKEVNDTYELQGSQSMIQVAYSGVNPCDYNFFYAGLNSFITGFELSGTVVKTGPTSPFAIGDQVCGLTPVNFPQSSSVGAHQGFAVAEAQLFHKIPSGLSLKDAGGIVMASRTAADALFNGLGFGLPAAGVTGTDPAGQSILIWGGASSVGLAAIQIAKVAGFSQILVTASPKNHDTLKRLGATKYFDYRGSSVVDEIRAAVQGSGAPLIHAFDTVGKGTLPGVPAEQNSPVLVRASLSGADPKDLKLVCTLPVASDSAFTHCLSYRPPGDRDAMGRPQDPELPMRARRVMEYLLEASARTVKMPAVTVIRGAEAGIREIQRVARGEASMEKMVIGHPL